MQTLAFTPGPNARKGARSSTRKGARKSTLNSRGYIKKMSHEALALDVVRRDSAVDHAHSGRLGSAPAPTPDRLQPSRLLTNPGSTVLGGEDSNDSNDDTDHTTDLDRMIKRETISVAGASDSEPGTLNSSKTVTRNKVVPLPESTNV